MVQKRHPQVASIMLQGFNGGRHQLERCKRVRHVSCGGRLRVAHLVGSGRWSPPSNSNGHGRPISASARVTALRVKHSGRAPLARNTTHTASSRTRSRSVSGWTPLFEAIRVLPDLATHEVPAPVVPRIASTCPSPFLPAAAGVAVHSTALATTCQLARLQGCWGCVGLPLKKPSPGYAVREVRA